MFNSFARILLVATAIAPVGVVYAWVAIVEGSYVAGISISAVCLFLLGACWFLLNSAQENLEAFNCKIMSVEAADRENMGFLVLYLTPIFTVPFGALNWHLWLPTLVIFGVITATGYSYHYNPLLGLLGWHFYRVTSEDGVTYVLVTRKQLHSAKKVTSVGQLTEYMLVDLEG